MSDRKKIAHIELDERTVVRRSPDIEHERAVAIFDLLEENHFAPKSDAEGPFRVSLSVEENRLSLDVRDEQDKPIEKIVLPLAPFRRIVKDYFLVCESYYNAIKRATPSQIEAIDMGRRGLHNEGADLLKERLADKVEIDKQTARRLFTLVCVLHLRG
jgi:uncharacterized protein (UPF0262 family)